jgi:hypothetical protein
MEHLLKIKCADSRVHVHILASTSVPFTLTTVQVPNLALTHTKRITVYHVRGRYWSAKIDISLWPPELYGVGENTRRMGGGGGGLFVIVRRCPANVGKVHKSCAPWLTPRARWVARAKWSGNYIPFEAATVCTTICGLLSKYLRTFNNLKEVIARDECFLIQSDMQYFLFTRWKLYKGFPQLVLK